MPINKISTESKSVRETLWNVIPNSEYTNQSTVNTIKKIGEKVSSAEQRLILGASALMSQPFIDGKNKNVDEKTRKVSVARTIAKIIVGTATGYVIRKGCIKGIDRLSKIPGQNIKSWETIFTPKGVIDNLTDTFAQYKNAIGTVVALVVMMFTNFAIDAPLTKMLTNVLIKRQENKQK